MSVPRTEAAAAIPEQLVGRLQQLVHVNKDSAAGFREAADAVGDRFLAADFRVWAADRTRQADELSERLTHHGQEAPEDESWLASLHQAWLKLRSALSSGDPSAVLAEVERGEDKIKAKYEEVLRATPGSAVHEVVHRQYGSVKAVHDRIRQLRDARKTG